VVDGLMAGEYILRTLFSSAAIESVVWDGQDYTERPFDTSAGLDITDVVVTLTTARSSIVGTVSGGSAAAEGAAVVAFTADRNGWTRYGFNPTRLRSVLAANDGGFRIEGLPAGEYYLVAVPASRERAWIEPGFFEAHVSRATRVRLDRSDASLAGVALSIAR
jgi:hypothetical protein